MMQSQSPVDVLIIGGGPVGLALGIELGLQNIRTIILEKHQEPMKTPRAQSLSARSMEFFMRWGSDKTLLDSLLLPRDLPQTGIWCSSLCGEFYYVGYWGDNKLPVDSSPHQGVRVPLWITENVLRKRLHDFPCVDFLTQHEVQGIQSKGDHYIVHALNKIQNKVFTYEAPYLACCDGANGPSKKLLNNSFTQMSEKTKMLATMFTSHDISTLKTVPDGIMYFVISEESMAFVGPIDLNDNVWMAQIIWEDKPDNIDETYLSAQIDKFVGKKVKKQILSHYFWDMQVQVADTFSSNNRVFWLGDAAHAFAPTGGLGLNTGFGDAENLGWKLAHVIKGQAPVSLLRSYEVERRPICENNLKFAKQNAEEFIAVKNRFPPSKDHKAFATAYASLGNTYLSSSGLTMGYGYVSSGNENPFEYTPKVTPGYFLPHRTYQNKPLYKSLSTTDWTLIISGYHMPSHLELETIKQHFHLSNINVLTIEANLYPYHYLLIRPDWHIASVGNTLESLLVCHRENIT